MARYWLSIEYLGTLYRGWQEQRNARTIAGEIQGAVAQAGGEVVELVGAGRTDAGVHALQQVAHLELTRKVDPVRFRWRVNDLLPADIHITAATGAPQFFHARHQAQLRSYVYQIATRRTALSARTTWWVKRELDPSRMAQALPLILGMHDFAAFCERPAEQKSTQVQVERVELVEADGLILIRLAASHFLWKMVRRLVGAAVKIGAGEWSVDDLDRLLGGGRLSSRAGTVAENTAPPQGLFLERVLYPNDPPLAPLKPVTPLADLPHPPHWDQLLAKAGGEGAEPRPPQPPRFPRKLRSWERASHRPGSGAGRPPKKK